MRRQSKVSANYRTHFSGAWSHFYYMKKFLRMVLEGKRSFCLGNHRTRIPNIDENVNVVDSEYFEDAQQFEEFGRLMCA